ncbi:SURF1 family protein [Rheinheimera sp. MMS21-TC3]|uniref:SURF1 family protein n=1 Tax=Rheinheimera sp. MMS21-TC3 TaxID=3072790 RepID=UPI0028C4D983|nr:SURF1 family protein [Rheinheimera sp. MMS21-TC3]WNO59802.1 SURF1 family protein [Rheinheimera sp. MMS21-TC3]
MRIKLANHIFALRIGWLCITVAVFIILINLSWWQLQRAAEKSAQLNQLAQQAEQAMLTATALAKIDLQQTKPKHLDGLKFVATATWQAPYIWLLDNQIVEGKVGYDVIVAAKLANTDRLLLVNLGWVAATSSRDTLPEITVPKQLDLTGTLHTDVSGMLLLGQNMEASTSWPKRIQQVNFAAFAEQISLPLYPALLYQQQQAGFIHHYTAVVMPPEKHHAYALQWFLLAIAVLGVALAASHQGRASYGEK